MDAMIQIDRRISMGKTGALDGIKLSDWAIDMISGSSAGICATFVAHPLDTVKVRFQISSNDQLTLRRCISDIYLREGVSLEYSV